MCRVWMSKKVENNRMNVNPTVETMTNSYLASHDLFFDKLNTEEKIKLVLKLEQACKSCPLHFESNGNIPSVLRPDSKYLFIGRNPSKTEVQAGKLFPSDTPQGAMMDKYLEFLGIGKSECSFINMCNCSSRGNRPVTSDEVSKCSYLTYLAITSLPNIKVIFPLGIDALTSICGVNKSPMEVLGEVFKTEINGNEYVVIPLPHPSQLIVNRELGQDVKSYLTSLRTFIK